MRRRDRCPERPSGWPVRARPDWMCEVLSVTSAKRDLVSKPRTLHRCGVDHYWIVDGDRHTLTVYRWAADGYTIVLSASAEETVRAEPFPAIELRVGALFED